MVVYDYNLLLGRKGGVNRKQCESRKQMLIYTLIKGGEGRESEDGGVDTVQRNSET